MDRSHFHLWKLDVYRAQRILAQREEEMRESRLPIVAQSVSPLGTN